MGGLAVLHPHDSIKDHLPRQRTLISSHMTMPHTNLNTNPNSTRSNRRKRSPEKKNNSKSIYVMADDFAAKHLVMGQVKILKRGEEITVSKNQVDEFKAGDLGDLLVVPTPKKPEMEPRLMRIRDFYAGSAIISSPPPSSLPLPAFFTKKNALGTDDDASADLRRILRLDLL